MISEPQKVPIWMDDNSIKWVTPEEKQALVERDAERQRRAYQRQYGIRRQPRAV